MLIERNGIDEASMMDSTVYHQIATSLTFKKISSPAESARVGQ